MFDRLNRVHWTRNPYLNHQFLPLFQVFYPGDLKSKAQQGKIGISQTRLGIVKQDKNSEIEKTFNIAILKN